MIDALAELKLHDQLASFTLVVLRTSGLVVFCPIFSSQLLPTRFRIFLAVTLAVVLLPVVPVTTEIVNGGFLLLYAVRELFVGLVLGLSARVLFDGIEGAARLIANQSGFSLASMVDPLTGNQSLTPALFQALFATALILAADLHHLFIRGLVHSYSLLPPEAAWPGVNGLVESVTNMGGRLFSVAVELAAPGLVVAFSIDLVLVLVGRAMPQAPVLIVGYPLKVAGGLIAMLLTGLATGSAIGWIGRTFASDGAELLTALGSK